MNAQAEELSPTCREVLDRVYEYLDGEADELDCEKIRAHLEECSPCLRQYDLDVTLKALVKRSCGCEQAPVELRERIIVSISEVRIDFGG